MSSALTSASPAPLDATGFLYYLNARNWQILPGAEELAFRHLVGRLDFAGLLTIIEAARAGSRPIAAVTFYRVWLEEADAKDPLRYAVYFNLGVDLANQGDRAAAAIAYRAALALKPDLHGAAINLGLALEGLGNPDQALEAWQQAIQPDQARTALLNQRGRLLEQLGRFDEAEKALFQSLLTDPHQGDAISHWIHLRLKMCAWPAFGSGIPGLSRDEMIAGAGGLSLMSLFDDNSIINSWVERWIERRTPSPGVRLAPENGYNHQRVRIGYLSSDYNLHPVSMLMAHLLEKHDRRRFEVFGYCIGKDDNSYLRQRVLAAFDQWFRVVNMTDEQVARLMREHELDILVDLNGLTDGTRMGIVRWKPAPVQITYLGFVGSLPVPELDYAIADEFVVPPELAGDFHPKPLYMPNCYQVNDVLAPVDPPPSRESIGLPADKFVYCCFSNMYKITEEIFDGWMRILNGTPNSVLWLLARTPWAQQNMLNRAAAHGVAPERLIFASPTSPAQYLARLSLADVFLDTYPYNSGTTASDALRMGLPLVTLSGKTFSSRMAGSLLHAVGLGAGTTYSLDDYVALATRLGNYPAEYKAFRDTLAEGEAWRRTLGDIDRFVLDYEDRLLSVVKRPGKTG